MTRKRKTILILSFVVVALLSAFVFHDGSGDPLRPLRPYGKPNGVVHRSDGPEIWRIEALSVSSLSVEQAADLLSPLERKGWAKLQTEVRRMPADSRFLLPGQAADQVVFRKLDRSEAVAVTLFDGGAVSVARLRKLGRRERIALWATMIPRLETEIPEQRIQI